MVDSVDDLKSSQSIHGHRIPNFEMLDAKIGSSLKKIIQKIKLQEKSPSGRVQQDDRSFCGRQIAFMIYEYYRVIGAQDTVSDFVDSQSVFATMMFRNSIKIPTDDVLEIL